MKKIFSLFMLFTLFNSIDSAMGSDDSDVPLSLKRPSWVVDAFAKSQINLRHTKMTPKRKEALIEKINRFKQGEKPEHKFHNFSGVMTKLSFEKDQFQPDGPFKIAVGTSFNKG